PSPCIADFTYEVECGLVTLTGQSSFVNPTFWEWTYDGLAPFFANQTLEIEFSECLIHTFCLTVYGGDPESSCTICHEVVVEDLTPPVALCLGIGVTLDANCNALITPQQIDGGSTDDCFLQSMSVSQSMFHGCGFFPVTLTVTDWCGNTSSCPTTVQTFEDVPPMIRCPSNVTVTAASPAPCSKVVNNLQPTNVSDNCSTPTVTYTITGATSGSGANNASGLTFNQGVSTITYTATDDCGNSTSCSFTVTVKCESNPSIFNCGMAVVTCFSGYNTPTDICSGVNQNAPVMALIDVRDQSAAVQGTWWQQASQSEYADPKWTPQNMGQVFGIAIDHLDDVYVTASTIYACCQTVTACTPPVPPFLYNPFTASGPGTVYKVDHLTGTPTPIITTGSYVVNGTKIPNNGSALGDIGYDAQHDQLFVTNHADGMIYRIKGGQVKSRFDPFGIVDPAASGPGSDPSFVALNDRTWGVAYYNGRVYFATWKEDIGRPNPSKSNEIWSIALNTAGEFSATTGTAATRFSGGEVLEITIPVFPASNFSNPVSDIAFSATGRMLLSERTMSTDCGGAFTNNFYAYAHSSRLLEYDYNTVVPGAWALTPGNTAISTSNTNLKYRIGTNNSGSNSAGGCDYGYASFDPNIVSQPDCDRFTWCTGDLLMNHLNYPGNLCTQPGNAYTWLYGLQGLSAISGGVWQNSLLIDLDNNICSHDKILLGDVEILKCGCVGQPSVCDSINVTSAISPAQTDSCCFILTLHNQSPHYFTGIQLCSSNGVSISAVGALNGWSISGYASQFISVVPPGAPGSFAPLGNSDFIKFCLSNYTNVINQQIIVKYYGPGETLVCMDTLNYNCSQKPKCLKLTDTVECADNGKYKMSFCIMSNALIGWNVNSIQLNPPPGITFTPSVFAVNNLLPGQMQCGFITLITGAVDGQTICYSVTAHNSSILINPEINPTTCCTDTLMLGCVTMPECICSHLSASATSVESNGDTCCWKVTLTNSYTNTFFTGVQLNIITPGVVFGAIVNPFSSGWSSVSNSTQVVFTPKPPGSFIGATSMLPTFCLSGINLPTQVPQVIVLTWLGPNGKTICKDTLLLDCEPIVYTPCAALVNWNVECDPQSPGYYNFSFQVTNNTAVGSNPGFTANQIELSALNPPGSILPSTTFNIPPLLPGQTSAVQTGYISGLSANQSICFTITLHETSAGSELNCCTNSETYCFTMPECSDSCCTDSLEFAALINQGFTVVNHGCTVIVTAPQFDSCYWFGTPPYVVGGYPVSEVITDPSGSWTFSFSNSGTYQICVTVFDGCQGQQMCTSVTVNCGDGCHCGTFSDMAIRFERGPGQPLTCGGPPVLLDCPPPGYSYSLTGKFVCQGSHCPENAPFDWDLKGPNGGTVASGIDIANPYFGISFSNLYFLQGGIYTLTMIGHCGTQACPCIIKFIVDTPCSNVCPCTFQDVVNFEAAANKGFSTVLSSASCQVCFTPIGLSDCETVEWYLYHSSSLGFSKGNNTFCYTFPGSGTYKIVMVSNRYQDDGTWCDSYPIIQNVTIICNNPTDCVNSIFNNPTFSEGAIAGNFNSGGHSNGWKASSGNPKVNEGKFESLDGWTIQLSGNLDTADILTQIEPVCLAKIAGMITVRIAVNDSAPGGIFFAKAGKEKKEDKMKLAFSRSAVKLNHCDGPDCYPLASIPFALLDTATWLDVQIPYDLSDWDVLDSCGDFPGVLVRPYIYVTNALSNDQGGAETFTYVQLDNFCINGTLVAVHDPPQKQIIQIYPNPTTGELILRFTSVHPKSGVIEVFDLYGRLMLTEKLLPDKESHTLSIASLPSAVYFVKVFDKGMPV
ncbi:MAG: T9SS type A sorting domain-containing protein, partial [Saprospiraceae bacterium]